jgi:hypothetical protein
MVHTDTQVGIDRSITSSTSQALVLPVRDVEVGLWVTVSLGQPKINNINLIAALADTHEEVVRLDITVDEGLGVDVLDAGDELIGEKKNCLQGELAVAEVKEVLQAGSEEIEDHGIVLTLSSEPADKWDTNTTNKRLVDTGLVFELRVLSLHALELDSNLFA